ncbi:hypothetical protein XA68_15468 [Ophiocordyceps unilateralis]|uniref:C2H2-type domain-containing protein n=1 Tax=Ophiocordyceps unilateralis TaxID=268505 RepID=A0A2A9P742_OPHUN|nr:hypothetical protein XA68_15468 [Ophiocordyceps unilateralis]
MPPPLPPPAHVFEHALDASISSSPLLDQLVRQHLDGAAHEIDMMESRPPRSGDFLLNDMGDYFCRTATLWAYLTESLLDGHILEEATLRAHERSRTDTGMSDLSNVARVDVDISRLRDMSLEFSHQVRSTWRPQTPMTTSLPGLLTASISPFCNTRLSTMCTKSMSVSSDGDQRSFKARKLLPDSHVQMHAAAVDVNVNHRSDDSDDSGDDLFPDIDMEALRQRGKGSYSCPKAYHCTKGGVDKEGNLIIFDRNSSFAQHCNKHRKPWRCEIPGCPNPPKKRRFARRDGLERHKTTVKHFAAT